MNKELNYPLFYYSLSHTVTKDNYYDPHVHGYYEILIILNGNGKVLIEGVEYPFEKNSLFLIPPGKYHVMTKLPDHDYERMIIYFNEEHLPSFIKRNEYYYKKISLTTRELALKYATYAKKYKIEVVNQLVLGFINEILLTEIYDDELKEPSNTYVSTLVKSAIEYINNNIDKPLSTKIIAKALFVSHTHLGHAFSKSMNVGIMHYVQIKKMYRAKELIKQGYLVTTVADMLGYKSYPTFIRNYKTYLGVNPSSDK